MTEVERSAGWNLEAIGYDAYFQAQFDALLASEPQDGNALVPARIAIAHGESYIAWAQRGSCKAILVGRRIAKWRDAADRPQVGDWIAGSYGGSAGSADALVIEHLLERRTCLMRLAAGETGAAQVIAANVDVVGIVSAFDEGKNDGKSDGKPDARTRRLINEPRLRRYLTAVEQSRAQPVVIVNKSDLSLDPEAMIVLLGQKFPGVPVALTSATQGGPAGLAALAPWLLPGKTLGLVGMSGVGKSTLANALLGRAAQRIGDVRDSDARGRHTTTHRELLLLESGALLIDTPGMRELGLWDEDETLSVGGFDDVDAIAARCRFTNCRHATEPDCAIRAALADGSLPADRWASFQKYDHKRKNPDARSGRPPPAGDGGGGRPHGPPRRRGR
jgi:ribosome biogenesis GTPase